MLNLRSQIHVMNNVSMATDGVGIDAKCGGPIKLTIPLKHATLMDDSKCVNAIELELNRAELMEFMIRTGELATFSGEFGK